MTTPTQPLYYSSILFISQPLTFQPLQDEVVLGLPPQGQEESHPVSQRERLEQGWGCGEWGFFAHLNLGSSYLRGLFTSLFRFYALIRTVRLFIRCVRFRIVKLQIVLKSQLIQSGARCFTFIGIVVGIYHLSQ